MGRLLAGGLIVAAAVIWWSKAGFEAWVILGPLLATALLVQSQAIVGQALARGTLWFHLVFGMVMLRVPFPDGQVLGLGLLLCSGTAMLMLGPKALGNPTARAGFSPVGLRRTLLAAVVVGVLAAQSTAVIAYALVEEGMELAGVLTGLFTVATLVSVVGVVKMRAWGALLYLALTVAAFVVAAVAALGGETVQQVLEIGHHDRDIIPILWAIAGGALAIGAGPALFLRLWGPKLHSAPAKREGWGHQIVVALVLVAGVWSFVSRYPW